VFYAATTSSPDNINRLVCVRKTFCVFCEVATTRSTLHTMFKVQAAAHTLGKHQEHKLPWFPPVFKSLLRWFPSPKLLPQAPLVLPFPFETHRINPHAQKPNSELFSISQEPKTPRSSFRAIKCNFILLLSEGRPGQGSESSNKLTPPRLLIKSPSSDHHSFCHCLQITQHGRQVKALGLETSVAPQSINWLAQLANKGKTLVA